VTFDYDGFLPTRTTWTGNVAGSVEWTYDSNFRPLTERVVAGTGSGTVYFGYDADGIVKCASKTACLPTPAADTLNLTPNPATGLIGDITLGSVSETRTYNGYGELVTQSVTFTLHRGTDAALFSHVRRHGIAGATARHSRKSRAKDRKRRRIHEDVQLRLRRSRSPERGARSQQRHGHRVVHLRPERQSTHGLRCGFSESHRPMYSMRGAGAGRWTLFKLPSSSYV
jgi:hypothetical protein